jgi:hypothetical protein
MEKGNRHTVMDTLADRLQDFDIDRRRTSIVAIIILLAADDTVGRFGCAAGDAWDELFDVEGEDFWIGVDGVGIENFGELEWG